MASTIGYTEIHIECTITEEQKTELLKQADNCYIHRMIEGDWDIKSPVVLQEEESLTVKIKMQLQKF